MAVDSEAEFGELPHPVGLRVEDSGGGGRQGGVVEVEGDLGRNLACEPGADGGEGGLLGDVDEMVVRGCGAEGGSGGGARLAPGRGGIGPRRAGRGEEEGEGGGDGGAHQSST